MPKDVTVTFEDGTKHVYRGAPDDLTPDQAEARAQKDFGKRVTALSRGAAPQAKPAQKPKTLADDAKDPFIEAGNAIAKPFNEFGRSVTALAQKPSVETYGGVLANGVSFIPKLGLGALQAVGAPATALGNVAGGAAYDNGYRAQRGYIRGMETPEREAALRRLKVSKPGTRERAEALAAYNRLSVDPTRQGARDQGNAALTLATSVFGGGSKAPSTSSKALVVAKPTKAELRAARVVRDFLPTRASTVPEGQLPFEAMGKSGPRVARAIVANDTPAAAQIEDAINANRRAMPGRMLQQIEASTGGKGSDFYNTLDALDQARKSAAAPLYEKAYQAPPMQTERLTSLMSRPSMKAAVARAYRMVKEEGVDPADIGFRLRTETVSPGKIDKMVEGRGIMGEPTMKRVQVDAPLTQKDTLYQIETPTPKMWDYIKRGLDDVLESKRDPVTGRLKLDEATRAIQQTRVNLREAIGEANPDLAAAWDAYAGPSRQMTAMAKGRKLVNGNMDPELIAQGNLRNSADEASAQNLGTARGLTDALMRNPKAFARNAGENALMQGRVSAGLNNPKQAENLFGAARKAAQSEQTYQNILGGSRTTPLSQDINAYNQAADNTFADHAFDLAKRYAGGERLSKQAARLAMEYWDRLRIPALRDPEVARIISDVLLGNRAPEDVVSALVRSKKISQGQGLAMLNAISAATKTSAIGGASTAPLALPPARVALPNYMSGAAAQEAPEERRNKRPAPTR